MEANKDYGGSPDDIRRYVEDYDQNWIGKELAGVFFRKTQTSYFDFQNDIKVIKKRPNLKDFQVIVSKNGGPIAMMLKG